MIIRTNTRSTMGQMVTVLSAITVLSIYNPRLAQSEQIEHTLNGYLQWALVNNPALVAGRAAVAAKKKDVRLALTIPDPTISGGYFISEVETRVGPQKAKVGASQMIPWPGKMADKHKIAEHELEASQEQLRAAEANIFGEIRGVYSSLFMIGRSIEINKENLALLKHMESVLLSKYATATATQMSVLKLQVEMAVVEDRLVGLDVDAAKTRENIRSLLNVGQETSIPFPSELPKLNVPDVPAGRDNDILKTNPALKEARSNIAAASATVSLARQGFAPDFMLMTDYIFTDKSTSAMVAPDENGKNPWIIGGSITVPLWTGSKITKVQKARAMETMKLSMAQNIENIVTEKSISLFEDHTDALRRASLYEKALIPKARQTLAIVDESYANGQASVLDYLDAQRMLLKLEIALVMQQARMETIAGKIDALMGGELTRIDIGKQ